MALNSSLPIRTAAGSAQHEVGSDNNTQSLQVRRCLEHRQQVTAQISGEWREVHAGKIVSRAVAGTWERLALKAFRQKDHRAFWQKAPSIRKHVLRCQHGSAAEWVICRVFIQETVVCVSITVL